MIGTRGYTVVELVIATAIMLTMTGAVMTLLHDGLATTPVVEDATDLHQRARVVAEVLTSDLRAAGGGTASGPLSASVPGVEPRGPGDGAGSASDAAVTIRYVPTQAARSRLLEDLAPASGSVTLDLTGCPSQTTACGFNAGMYAMVFDSSGQMDMVHVDAIGPGTLSVSASPPRGAPYPAGAEIAEAVEASYVLDPATRQLRRSEGGGTFAVADQIEAITFEYLGEGAMPLALSMFQDGPFGGTGDRTFDLDLLGVRAVVVTVRFTSASAPPSSLTSRFTVALRNGT